MGQLMSNYKRIFSKYYQVYKTPYCCCDQCTTMENWAEMIITSIEYQSELSEEKRDYILVNHLAKRKPQLCKVSELVPCGNCSRLLCPKCAEEAEINAKEYRSSESMCHGCVWAEIT